MKERLSSYTLRNRIRLIVLIALIPLLIIQVGYIVIEYQTLRAGADKANEYVARLASDTVQAFIQDILHQELAIGIHFTTSGRLSADRMNRILAANVRAYVAVRAFSWYDPQTHKVIAASTGKTGLDYRDRDYIRQIVAGKEWAISDLIISRAPPHDAIFTISRGIYGQAGNLIGIMIAGIDADRMDTLIRTAPTDDVDITIVDGNGRAVFRYPKISWDWERRNLTARWPGIGAALDRRELTGIFASLEGNGKVLLSTKPVSSTRWIVCAETPLDSVEKTIGSRVAKQAALFLLLSAVFFAAAVMISNALTSSVDSFSEHIFALTHSRTPQPRKPGGPVELQKLASSVDLMACAIVDKEEALQETEKKYRILVETANEGIWSINRDQETTFVNGAMAKMLGYAVSEMIGKKVEDFLFPEDLAFHKERMDQRHAGKDEIYERRFRKKDGSALWTIVSATAIRDNNGDFSGSLAMFIDITKSKQAEEERRTLQERLQRAEKMEALGLLAGGVAHDLNNALGILVGYAEILHDRLDDSEHLREDTRSIISGGEQAAAIVQDLLTMARRGVQAKTAVNLNRIVAEYLKSAEFAKLQSLHPGVRVTAEPDEELLLISGSRVHLSKTLANLVGNAAEAIASGGEIVIRTLNLYLDEPVSGFDELKEGDYAVLSVADNGGGIAPDDLKRIFEPFYTKKVMGRSGTGLGLSVVWGTVKDHNGYIDVDSEQGKGTTFRLFFPITHDAETEEELTAPPGEYAGRGERILVVDDSKEQRELAVRILSKLNYIVESAASGEDAVEYLKKKEADLVVLDMIMEPGLDGYETYRRIAEFKPRQKAVIVSGYAETDKVRMAQALGAGAFVRKPYIKERIGLAIRRELDKRAAPS